MRLFCLVHATTEEFTEDQAEKLVYALQAAYADALTHDYTEFGDDTAYELSHMCPTHQLTHMAFDPNVHDTTVKAMVGLRENADLFRRFG